jgi:replication factor C subunit 3/5
MKIIYLNKILYLIIMKSKTEGMENTKQVKKSDQVKKYLVDKYIPKKNSDIFNKNIELINKLNPELYKDKYNDWRYQKYPYFHKKLLSELKTISKFDDLPHIIFYGNGGTGKNTVINLFLEMVYDNSIYNLNDIKYDISSSNNTNDEVFIKQSDHHIVIEPSNTNFDRYLVQDVIKQYVKVYPLQIFENSKTFKSVQINNLDNLTRNAQTSLRCTIENNSKTCRFVMWCNSLSKVISPLRSRCVCIHIPLQEDEELIEWALNIALLEKIKISYKTIKEIIKLSNGNLKDILWRLDLFRYKKTINNSYHTMLNELDNLIVKKYDISEIRKIIYSIFVLNKPTQLTICDIMNNILKKIDSNDLNKSLEIINTTAEYEYRLSLARRDTPHLEAYIVAVINILFYSKKI